MHGTSLTDRTTMLVPITVDNSVDNVDEIACGTRQAYRKYTQTAKKVTAESASALQQVFDK